MGTADNICVSARVSASVRQDTTFDKHGGITMWRCQRVLSLVEGVVVLVGWEWGVEGEHEV